MANYHLKDLIEIKNGRDYKHLSEGNIPVFGSGGYMFSVSDYLYDGKAILLPRKGTLDNIMFVNGKFWTVDTMYYSIVNDSLSNPYYLYNYLKILNLGGIKTGSTLPSMTNSAYYGIPIKLPNLEQQNKVAKILFAINQKIELNNRINTELEQTAKDLYNYWFIQFDFPDGNGRPYKSSGGKMVYNEKLKREIPEGWEVKYVSDFCDVVTGKEDANFATTNGNFSFFTCGDEILKCDSPAFRGKSVLIAGNGNFNVKYYEGVFNAYQRTYVLIPEEELYIGIIYKSMIEAISRFTKGSNGSIVKFITKGDIEKTPIMIPKNKELLKPFNNYLSTIDHLKKEINQHSTIRDFLLPMLMNGQVAVQG